MTRTLKQQGIAVIAEQLMARHGLIEKGWKFDFSRGKRTVGLCSYQKQTIFLSRHFVENTPAEELVDTVLHEIAHALTPGAKHGYVWKLKCMEIGAKPKRCTSKAVIDPEQKIVKKFNYTISCETCGWKHGRIRIKGNLHRHVCNKCRSPITITEGWNG